MAEAADESSLIKPSTFEPSAAAFVKWDPDADCELCNFGTADAFCVRCKKGWCSKCFGFRIPSASENADYLRRLTSEAKISLGDAFVEGRLCLECYDAVHGRPYTARHPLTKEPLLYVRVFPSLIRNGYAYMTRLQHALFYAAQINADEMKEPFDKAPALSYFDSSTTQPWACHLCSLNGRASCPRHKDAKCEFRVPATDAYASCFYKDATGKRVLCVKCATKWSSVQHEPCPDHSSKHLGTTLAQ